MRRQLGIEGQAATMLEKRLAEFGVGKLEVLG